MRKLVSVVLILAMALCLVPAALAAEPKEVDPETAIAYNTLTRVYYETLEEAVSNLGFFQTVVLLRNYTLQESITISSYAKVIVPSEVAYTGDTNDGHNTGDVPPTPEDQLTAPVTLTVPEGKSITITGGGTLLVAGNQQSDQPQSGFLYGTYGAIDLSGEILVSSGNLYARGLISGTGTITVESNGSVYQRFEIQDWRGGTASRAANDVDVFPFNLYQLGGIDTTVIYKSGSSLYGQAYIYAGGVNNNAEINYIGPKGLVQWVDSDGNITMTKDNGITTATVNAAIRTGDLSFTFRVLGIPITISSNNKDCPFGYHLNLVMAENSSLTVNAKLKMLPGCTFTVSPGATMTLSSTGAMYFYGKDTYKQDYYYVGSIKDEFDYRAAATLKNSGEVVLDGGTIGSTDSSFVNVEGFTSTGTTVNVLEYNQTSGKIEVPFYVGTSAA